MLLDDLKETFANLQRYRMKLNPEKCTFGVLAGQLLGYIIFQRGIKANPSKIKAIEALEKPTVGPRVLSYIEMLCVLVMLAMSDTGVTSPRPEHHRQVG
jgi:hypothetical protein